MQGLPQDQQQQLMQAIEQMQVRDRCAACRRCAGAAWGVAGLVPCLGSTAGLLAGARRAGLGWQQPAWLAGSRLFAHAARQLGVLHRPCTACPLRSLRMYNSLVERCFRDCVDSFRRKDLDAAEEKVRALEWVWVWGVGGCRGGAVRAHWAAAAGGPRLTCLPAVERSKGGRGHAPSRLVGSWAGQLPGCSRRHAPKPRLNLTRAPPRPAPPRVRPPQCVQSCCAKFMKHSARVGLRFGELSSEAESQMAAIMQQQAGGGK